MAKRETPQANPNEHWQFPGVELLPAPQPARDDPWRSRIVAYGYVPNDKLEASILFHPMNWRTHPPQQEEGLLGAIEEVGIVQNCLVNINTGRLLDGHDRVKLAKRAGAGVYITFVDVSEDEEEIILAEFDTLTSMAGTDRAKLSTILENLRKNGTVKSERLGTMLTDLRERLAAGGSILPGTGTEAAYTDNPYESQTGREGKLRKKDDDDGDDGDDSEELDDHEGQRVRLIQLFYMQDKYNTVMPLLQALGGHFKTDNVTDTVYDLAHWAAEELGLAPSGREFDADETPDERV